MNYITIFLALLSFSVFSKVDTVSKSFNSVEIDTSHIQVFDSTVKAKFKLNYYHTEGYSLKDRYSYEVIILDSLIILNFKCPKNDDQNYINYQKQSEISYEQLDSIKTILKNVNQKQKGFPLPPASGYGADKLFVENGQTKINGGTVYIAIGNDLTDKDYLRRINHEKQISTTISGDYQKLFNYLESIFSDLSVLKNSISN